MKIGIVCKIPDCEVYDITLGECTKQINDVSSAVMFEVDTPGKYEICIEQCPEHCLPRWAEIGIFIVTMLIQGIFHIVTFNSDLNWEVNIRAYRLKTYLDIDVTEDMKIQIECVNSYYSCKHNQFIKPKIIVCPKMPMKTKYLRNDIDIMRQYSKFVRKIISVSVVMFSVFAILLYYAISLSNSIAIVTVSFFIIAFVSVIIFVIIRNHMKKGNLYAVFESTTF